MREGVNDFAPVDNAPRIPVAHRIVVSTKAMNTKNSWRPRQPLTSEPATHRVCTCVVEWVADKGLEIRRDRQASRHVMMPWAKLDAGVSHVSFSVSIVTRR